MLLRPAAVEQSEGAPAPKDPKARTRPLYDIPYMFEAREFLRKRLIGKKVSSLNKRLVPQLIYLSKFITVILHN